MAKYVFLENLLQLKAERIGAAEDARQHTAQRQPVKTESDDEAREKMHGCLEKCLDELPNDDRELILEYYRGVAAGGFALGPPVERAWHPPTGRVRFSG